MSVHSIGEEEATVAFLRAYVFSPLIKDDTIAWWLAINSGK